MRALIVTGLVVLLLWFSYGSALRLLQGRPQLLLRPLPAAQRALPRP